MRASVLARASSSSCRRCSERMLRASTRDNPRSCSDGPVKVITGSLRLAGAIHPPLCEMPTRHSRSWFLSEIRGAVAIRFLECSNREMIGTTAADVARGASRLLIQEGYSPILEFTLPNGRRLDVGALGADGCVLGVEIKVAVPDL